MTAMTGKRTHSLFRKIIIPLIVLMLLQSVIFFGATFYGGVSGTINQNAEDILAERVINQEQELEAKFTTQWANFGRASDNIGHIYDNVAGASGRNLYEDAQLQRAVLADASGALIDMLRSNEVTGVFLILNNAKDYEPLRDGTQQERYGLCIRDYSPTSEYADREDLLVVRSPSSLVADMGCSMEAWWDARFTFNSETPGDYYYKPIQMAYENPDAETDDLAYFDGPHSFMQADRAVVSYSIPLRDKAGYPYGVLGIELTTDYLKTLMPTATLSGDNAGCYVLAQYTEDSETYQTVAYNGAQFQQCFRGKTTFQAKSRGGGMIECENTEGDVKFIGSVSDLQIYNHNTPYEKQKFAVIGLVRENALYGINTIVKQRLILVSALVMLFGCLSVLLISRRLTRPINKLSQKVRGMDGGTDLRLERLNIDEIDDLVESIEGLSEKVSRNFTRTEFFSRMSHDMRTPMNAIIGFSSPELLESADPEQIRDYMDKIHSSGSYLLTLINEVLDMSKIEMQQMELRENVITQKNLLVAVVPMIREIAQKKGVKFEIKADDSETPFYCDSQRMSQVLMNLLSNAVRFTEPGGTVRLEVMEVGKDEEQVVNFIRVSDNGCGMSEEFQEKMYEPFAQEGRTGGGTGLGLAIARQIITLMGGTMNCVSVPEKGTTFELYVTSRIAQMQSSAEGEQNGNGKVQTRQQTVCAPGESGVLSGRRVLLCEDHPMNAQIARRLLERKGMIVEEARDGAEGLKRFWDTDPGTYDVILMDIRMPRMNGLETAQAIRALQREDAQSIPIIAMTANAFKEDREASKNAGMNAHLSKPIDPKILYATLEMYLDPERLS
ncbi:Signal transduction histidine kinase [Hespellia stercorisuis DSM 15480]|uniref:Stage 0 sporulation protein A homolog n=2 Tax=Hespellia stercorisuis TaxID=180311 RepID=A0A1M6M6J0_9FIRM|nr:Signal transduction histidine kinase [Hespellia stercorisuis DSM 15480]